MRAPFLADRYGQALQGHLQSVPQELKLFAPGQERLVGEAFTIEDLADPRSMPCLGSQADELRDEVALLEGAANPFDLQAYLKGSQTPVFFGSAINNFGVREMLDAFVEIAPPPSPGRRKHPNGITPGEAFPGLSLKSRPTWTRPTVTASLFCASARALSARHALAPSPPRQGDCRRQPDHFHGPGPGPVEEAWPGDIIGIHNHGTIKIGDTFSEKEPLKFTGIPSFAPEHFRRVRLKSPLKAKQLNKGLIQLAEEGAVQVFRPVRAAGSSWARWARCSSM
jgi:peptide chain release factor 3